MLSILLLFNCSPHHHCVNILRNLICLKTESKTYQSTSIDFFHALLWFKPHAELVSELSR